MLLAIDTCGASGGVALGSIPVPNSRVAQDTGAKSPESFHEEHAAAAYRELAGRTFSEELIATVSALLRDAAIGPTELAAIVVINGPGSFTGIRIGVSAAKGLAAGLGIPVLGLSRLELLARKAADTSAVAVLDAGRGEFFVGIYRQGDCEAELLLTREALLAAIPGWELPVLVCEQRAFDALVGTGAELVASPTAADALEAGRERYRAGEFVDAAALDAHYLRRSEVEMLERIAHHAALRAASPTRTVARS